MTMSLYFQAEAARNRAVEKITDTRFGQVARQFLRVRKGWAIAGIMLLAAIAPSLSQADGVYICTKAGAKIYSDCGDANTIITNAPKDTDLVAVIDNGVVGLDSWWYNISMHWQVWSTISNTALIGMCGGTETALQKCAYGNGGQSGLQYKNKLVGLVSAPPAAWAYEAPICYAKDDEERKQFKAIPPRLIVAWYCNRPGGIQGYVRVYSFTDMVNVLKKDIPFGLARDQKSLLDRTITTRRLTTDEDADATAFLATARPKATVSSASGTYAPVYLANADRTLGAKTTKTVPAGTACSINDRLVTWNTQKTIATATSYYAVTGGFALCNLTGAVSQ